MKNIPKSIESLIKERPILEHSKRGLPDLGKHLISDNFSPEVKKIYDAFAVYGNELYQLEKERIKNMETRSLGGGSPMKTSVFPPCKTEIMNYLAYNDLSEYPLAAGDEDSRKEILKYLRKEGFKSNRGLDIDNIIFTVSSTQAFNIILNIISRPNDVILMTGPNYGLFTFAPERVSGANVEILPLKEEDNWYINPDSLSRKIDEINENLYNKYGDSLGYVPKVVAFLNANPHNPLGKVMNAKNKNILEKIGQACLDKGVFVIDDIIYRDLTYDRENLSIPMGTYEKYFDNTITITGLSKSYGLASLRAGMIVANEAIIRGVRNYIFQTMYSSPVLQGKALAGAFNSSYTREQEYEKYFNPIMKEYKYRLELLKALVKGLDYVKNKETKYMIEKDIRNLLSIDLDVNKVLDGIPNVDFVNKTIPESGFFALLDFTKLKDKENEGRIVTSEIELLKYLYEQEKIKLILGSSISWPNRNQLVGRVTTALERDDLINHMGSMNKCIRKLK